MRSIEQTTIKLNKLWKENFPELTLTQLLNKIQNYYGADISFWSNEKLVQYIEFYAKDMQKRKKEPEPRPNDDAVFNLPFEPFKATAIELEFENCEGVIIPIDNITSLRIENEHEVKTWNNSDCEKKFEYFRTHHTAESIIISFARNDTYTSSFTLKNEPDGETHPLMYFLNRRDIAAIRCLYKPKHFSYSIYPTWIGDNYINKLQYTKESYNREINLYLGNIVTKLLKEKDTYEY